MRQVSAGWAALATWLASLAGWLMGHWLGRRSAVVASDRARESLIADTRMRVRLAISALESATEEESRAARSILRAALSNLDKVR